MLQPFHGFVLEHHCFDWRPRLARRAFFYGPGVLFDCLSHLIDRLVAILFFDRPTSLFDQLLTPCRVEGQSEAYFRPLGRKLLLRCRYGAERRFGTLVLAGRLDAGVSRSASLLAASLSDGGDIAAKPTTAHPVPHFFQAGSCFTKISCVQVLLGSRAGKPLELWFLALASVSVLTAMLDYRCPPAIAPSVLSPKVRPYGGLAMVRQVRLPVIGTRKTRRQSARLS